MRGLLDEVLTGAFRDGFNDYRHDNPPQDDSVLWEQACLRAAGKLRGPQPWGLIVALREEYNRGRMAGST